jgi:hypothetical protein
MACCFTYHSAAAACQEGYGLAELSGLFLAPRTCGKSLCMKNIVCLGAKPSETGIAFATKLVSNCTPLHVGVKWRRLFRWYNALSTTWLGPKEACSKALSTLVLLWEDLGPGAATTNFGSRAIHGHVNLETTPLQISPPEDAAKRAAPGFYSWRSYLLVGCGICRERVFDSGREGSCATGAAEVGHGDLAFAFPSVSHPGPCSRASHEYILVQFHNTY